MYIIQLPPVDVRSRSNQYTERSDTLHLSNITGDILMSLDAEKYGAAEENEGRWMNYLVGLIFERIIELAWLDKEIEGRFRPGLIRPGEISRDGVTGTPDMFDYMAGDNGRPLEFKATKKSCRYPVTDARFWVYWVQLKAYIWMMRHAYNLPNLCEGELHILHINGNYSRDDADPENNYIIKSYLGRWTVLELEENWLMLIGHAKRRGMLP